MLKLICSAFFLLCCASAQAENSTTRIGYAYSADDNKLLYTEHHAETFDGALVLQSTVVYKDIAGQPFAQKMLNFNTDKYLPEFSLSNEANGHQESTRYFDAKYEVYFLKNKNKQARTKVLDYAPGAISDAGFDNFVIHHWDALIAGKKFSRDFLIPSMLRFIKFNIYQKEIIEEAGRRYRLLHIEPNNFFLRTLSGAARLVYEFDRPTLTKFEGTSNMRDAEGDNYKVVIRYENEMSAVSMID